MLGVMGFWARQLLPYRVVATVSLGLLFSGPVVGSGLQEPSPIPAGGWNSSAIKVTFDGVMLDDGQHLLLYYVLNNATNVDYQLKDGSNVAVMMKVRGHPGGWRELSAADLRVFYPIFVPSRERQIVVVKYLRRAYEFRLRLELHASPKEKQAFQEKLKTFVRRQSPDLGGFALFDKNSGYRIDLPCDF